MCECEELDFCGISRFLRIPILNNTHNIKECFITNRQEEVKYLL